MAANLPTSLADEFLADMATRPTSRGSLVFALDATASREPTWDIAADLQAKMFADVAGIGGLDVKLVYFRGADRVAECKASGWTSDPIELARLMTKIQCRAGLTQIERVLALAARESSRRKIGALVYVGDCCEESRDCLISQARQLGERDIPMFVFQEDHDPEAELIFRKLAQITRGAYSRFDQGSARQLGELLRAVAAFAVGGVAALERQGTAAAQLLIGQIR
jgi:hypothetical protein